MTPTLCVAIPTVVGREAKFDAIWSAFQRQIEAGGLQQQVRLISAKDNKEVSLGAKRQTLYEMARKNGAVYTVQWDDDDGVADDYCMKVLAAVESGPDCVGYLEDCVVDGVNIGKSVFSRDYPGWIEHLDPPFLGCVRVRTPFFKTPIKTDLCLRVGVADMRYAEDRDFSVRILPHLRTQVLIPEVMYLYRYETEGTHGRRYGIS